MTGFVEALHRAGHEVITVVSWEQLLAKPDALLRLPAEPAMLRIESSGENDRVQRALLALGGGPDRPVRHGELVAPMAAHRGFERALGWIAEALEQRPQWVPLATPAAILGVFDKVDFHRRSRAAGIRVAQSVPATTARQLLTWLDDHGGSVFVKLRVGSSASGLALVRTQPRPRAMTTVRTTPQGRFNSLRVARIDDRTRIEQLLTWLIEEESAHVELAVPKARLDGAFFDCRVLTIAGEPRFTVVRQSSHPITNLHLGGRRGDLSSLRAACPEDVWEAAMADCRQVTRAYGGLHLGIDVLFERGYQGHRILEANAFGDLIPRLTHAGRSVYETEIHEAPRWASHTTATVG
ncbi:MAG: STM4014 family protein [Myxococcales bacterium]|nr:STM4014 family protein [Myxococcales bacterium]